MLECIWDELSRAAWQKLLARMPEAALQQDWAYGEAVQAQGHTVRRCLVAVAGEPAGLAQFALRRLPFGLTVALLLRGPAWRDAATAAEHAAGFAAAAREELGPGILLWTPELRSGCEAVAGRRVMSGMSTAFVDLRPPPAVLEARLDGKWRNMLRRAREQRLRIVEVSGGPLLHWLIEENEAYRRRVGYRGPSPAFLRALADASRPARATRLLVAQAGSEPVAGVWMQCHGPDASYLVGCTSERGRELRAHHLLLWEAVLRLRAQGVRRLDLGGLDTVNAPGVARFKLGLGGEVVTLAGTFLLPLRGSGRRQPADARAAFVGRA